MSQLLPKDPIFRRRSSVEGLGHSPKSRLRSTNCMSMPGRRAASATVCRVRVACPRAAMVRITRTSRPCLSPLTAAPIRRTFIRRKPPRNRRFDPCSVTARMSRRLSTPTAFERTSHLTGTTHSTGSTLFTAMNTLMAMSMSILARVTHRRRDGGSRPIEASPMTSSRPAPERSNYGSVSAATPVTKRSRPF